MAVSYRLIEELDEALGLLEPLCVFGAEIAEELGEGGLARDAVEARLRRSFDASESLLLVAEEARGERPLGLCWSVPFHDPLTEVCRPMVIVLGIERAYRHRGLARALVQAALEILKARGHRALAVRAAHNDDAIISMAERWGFVRRWEWMLHE